MVHAKHIKVWTHAVIVNPVVYTTIHKSEYLTKGTNKGGRRG